MYRLDLAPRSPLFLYFLYFYQSITRNIYLPSWCAFHFSFTTGHRFQPGSYFIIHNTGRLQSPSLAVQILAVQILVTMSNVPKILQRNPRAFQRGSQISCNIRAVGSNLRSLTHDARYVLKVTMRCHEHLLLR